MAVKARHRDVVAAQSRTVRKCWRQDLNSEGGTPNHQCHASGESLSQLPPEPRERNPRLTDPGLHFPPQGTGRWGWDKGVT